MESKWFGYSRSLWAALVGFLPAILTALCASGIWCAQRGFLEAITDLNTAAGGAVVGGLALVARLKLGGLSPWAIGAALIVGLGQAFSGSQVDPALSKGAGDFAGSFVALVSAALLVWSKMRPDTSAGPAPLRLVPPAVVATS